MHKHTASPLPGPALIGIVNAAASWPGMDLDKPLSFQVRSTFLRRRAGQPRTRMNCQG